MLVVMDAGVSDSEIERVVERMITLGFDVHRSSGMRYTVLGGIGDAQKFDVSEFKAMPGVREAIRITSRWKLASKRANPEGTVVRIGVMEVGGSGEAAMLPGDAMIREVWESSQVRVLSAHGDALIVPSQAMENEALLRELGRAGLPVILTRGEVADLDTWLFAADLILQAGNKSVVLCESGVRSVAGKILDIGAIAEVRRLTHLPVIAAPGRVSEHAEVTAALARAAIAAGAHGILE
jgi:3-deoxy-7-phosphoheptulonate synthase